MTIPSAMPENTPGFEQRASALYRAGNMVAAIELYETRVKEQPEDIAAWRNLARLLIETWQFARADAVITQALALGTEPGLLALQLFAKQELGLPEQARAIALHAATRFPDHLSFQFDARLLLPMIYADRADLAARRKRYEAGLGELETLLPVMQRNPARIYTLARTNFLLAYQGEDDLPLQRRYANILGSIIAAADPAMRELPARAARLHP